MNQVLHCSLSLQVPFSALSTKNRQVIGVWNATRQDLTVGVLFSTTYLVFKPSVYFCTTYLVFKPMKSDKLCPGEVLTVDAVLRVDLEPRDTYESVSLELSLSTTSSLVAIGDSRFLPAGSRTSRLAFRKGRSSRANSESAT